MKGEDGRFIQILADSLPGMVAYWGKDLRCRFANRAYLEWFGKAPEAVIGNTLLDLMGEQLYELNEPHIRAVLAGTPQNFERTLTKADGSTGYTWANYIPDIDAYGAIEGFTVLVSDVTELKDAQVELIVSEARFRGAFETAAHGMALVSLEGKFLKVNKSLCAILGYNNAELLALGFQAITHPEDLNVDLNYVHKLLEQEIESYQMEKRYFHKRGNIIWVLLSVSLVRTSEGVPVHFVSQIQDITLAKAAEQELRIAAATFETHDAIVITDANANIIKVNKAFTTISGYQPEEVLGKNPRMMNSGRHEKAFFESLFHKVLHDGSWVGEIWDKRKSGEIYPRWMTITAVRDAEQKISQFVGIFSDITEGGFKHQVQKVLRDVA